MTWRVAKSLDVLLRQVNAKWPERSKKSDGAKGDDAHASRASDHNPNAAGVVCARDFTNDPAGGPNARQLAETLVASRDERIKYIISNGQICSGPGANHPAWVWRPYDGPNKHTKHMHISVRPPAALYDDETPWKLGIPSTEPAAAAVGSTIWLQRALNNFGHKPPLKEDGIEGPATIAATRAFAVKAIQDRLKG
jgi:hypothetical protein